MQAEDGIYGLDINDELTRQEPWSYNERNDKLFIDALVNGRSWIMPNWSRKYALGAGNVVDNSHNLIMMNEETQRYYTKFKSEEQSALAKNSTARFIERVGMYNYDSIYSNNEKDDEGTGAMSGGRSHAKFEEADQTQSTTEFVDSEGRYVGSIANENAEQKKVIQYIYIKSRK